eukprot:SAG22_NODE_1349_length_4655_cov_6.900132_3_plen_145_part_00
MHASPLTSFPGCCCVVVSCATLFVHPVHPVHPVRVFEAAISEHDGGLLAGNLAGVPTLERVGSADKTISPWFTRCVLNERERPRDRERRRETEREGEKKERGRENGWTAPRQQRSNTGPAGARTPHRVVRERANIHVIRSHALR